MARSERSTYRKTQAMLDQTHGGNAGRSILEMLIEQLNKAATRYVEQKDARAGNEDAAAVALARGEVRGLARAISLMQNPYYPTRGIKELERDAVTRAREKKNAGQ